MQETITRLLELQDKDLRLANLQKQVRSVPAEQAKVEAELAADEQLWEAAKAGVQAVEKQMKSLEMEGGSAQAKRVDLLGKSAQIKKNEEYKAMLHEVEQVQKNIAGIDDQQLALMEKLEAAKAVRAKVEKERALVKARIDAARADLQTRASNCQAQLDKVKAERDAIAALVPPDALRLYSRLMAKSISTGKFRNAVGPLLKDTCGSCHLKTTPAVRQNVLRGQLANCEHCGVILYIED